MDQRRVEAGQKGGAVRRDLMPRCPYCGKRYAFDPARQHACLKAVEAFRLRAIEAVRAMTGWEYDSAAGGEFNRFTKTAVIAAIQSLPATSEERE